MRKSVIAAFFLCGIFLNTTCLAQSDRYQQLQQQSHEAWQNLVNRLELKIPGSLPLPADDPRRPTKSFQPQGSSSWTDSAGNTYARSPWGKWTNYEESKATPYSTLPDLLLTESGSKVTTPEMWWEQKRPEIVDDFSNQVYGKIPENVPAVHWHVQSVRDTTIGKMEAIRKELVGEVENSMHPSVSVEIKASLILPVDTAKAVPAMIHFAFQLPPGFERPKAEGPTWQEQVLQKGWGYVNYYPYSVQADFASELTKGIIGLTNKGKPRKPDEWGALRAWAWGAGRVLDYLESDKHVDAKSVGVEGVSRFGKAALVAMAFDQRFATGLIGSSGKGGATLFRRNYGETIGILASSGEYHWFAGNFIKYAGPFDARDLPVDTHELIALCAPRPVFISTGSPEVEGRWLDNKGQFMAAKAASPVYELLGNEGLRADSMPSIDTLLANGRIAFRSHSGGHTDVPNWPYFLEFADQYLGD